jgi:endoplasmic reticulum Man9GlcNAc2 1,2-alpha-mannosidase
LDQVVFNTEAHAFPRFELGKLFETGWNRTGSAGQEKKEEQEEKSLSHVVKPEAAKEGEEKTKRVESWGEVVLEDEGKKEGMGER